MSREPTHWAIVVGINHYSESKENLKGCVHDANVMKQYFETSVRSKLNLVLLTASAPTLPIGKPLDEEEESWPTCKNVVANLDYITAQARRGDRVLFYFAGHGTNAGGTSPRALILIADNGCGIRYFRLNALYKRVEKIVENGVAVTLILDCCHSGAIVRGDEQNEVMVRCLEFDPDVAIDAETTTPGLGNFDITRDAEMDLDWLKYATGLVVICACAPEERTYEEMLGGQFRGIFTHSLIFALNMLAKDGIDVTHAAVHEKISTSLHAHWSKQTPMRYGKVDDVLLGDSMLASHKIAVYSDQNGTLRLRAGEVHGIVKGDEFHVSPGEPGTTAIVANVRATIVRAVESDLVSIDGRLGQCPIRGWQAKPLSSLSPRVISVGMPPQFSTQNRAFTEGFPRYLRLLERNFVSTPNPEVSCAYSVVVNAHDEYEIVNPMLEKVFPIPAIQRNSDCAQDQIMRILQHIADFKYFEGLENRVPCPRIQESLQITCRASAESPDIIKVMHGERVTFTFVNTGDKQLYVSVFDLNSSWEIAAMMDRGFKILPARGDTGNGSAEVTLGMEVPEYFENVTDEKCEDHIKFLVSTKPTHFRWGLPTIFETIQDSGSNHRGDDVGLNAYLANFFGDLRGDEEDEWTTRSFFIHTSARTASLESQ